MATFTPVILSGSTNGRGIKVAATSTPGTTIHTDANVSGGFDELTLYAFNTDTTARKLTIEFGGTTSPDDTIEMTVPPESGLVLICERQRINGGVVVKAFCASANVVNIIGNVNRYAP